MKLSIRCETPSNARVIIDSAYCRKLFFNTIDDSRFSPAVSIDALLDFKPVIFGFFAVREVRHQMKFLIGETGEILIGWTMDTAFRLATKENFIP